MIGIGRGTGLRELRAVWKLLRIRPVLAWGLCGALLGVAIAVHEVGLGLYWEGILIGVLGIILVQGVAAHGINDLVDIEVDRDAPIEKTGRVKVLILGWLSPEQLKALVLASIAGALILSAYLYTRLGWPILVFMGVAVWAPLSYSLPPLRLGWRPFNEFVVALPSITAVTVGAYFVASHGSVSLLSLSLVGGVIHAFLNMSWFVVSRIPDVEADRAHGKVTTVVWLGLNMDRAKKLALLYMGAGYLAEVIVTVSNPLFLVGLVTMPLYLRYILALDPDDSVSAAGVRLKCMRLTSVHAILVSLSFFLLG